MTKPWVREESDAAVVRQIESGGTLRLIPIVLDEDVPVPAALKHLLGLSVLDLGLDRVVDSRRYSVAHAHRTFPDDGSLDAVAFDDEF